MAKPKKLHQMKRIEDFQDQYASHAALLAGYYMQRVLPDGVLASKQAYLILNNKVVGSGKEDDLSRPDDYEFVEKAWQLYLTEFDIISGWNPDKLFVPRKEKDNK